MRWGFHKHPRQSSLQADARGQQVSDLSFRQSTYYRARKGTRPLLPTEQQFVLETLKRCKADSSQEFDAYYEDYDWE